MKWRRVKPKSPLLARWMSKERGPRLHTLAPPGPGGPPPPPPPLPPPPSGLAPCKQNNQRHSNATSQRFHLQETGLRKTGHELQDEEKNRRPIWEFVKETVLLRSRGGGGGANHMITRSTRKHVITLKARSFLGLTERTANGRLFRPPYFQCCQISRFAVQF